MKFVILTALIAAVSSSSPESGEIGVQNGSQWPWETGKIYRYVVDIRNLIQHEEEAQATGNLFKTRLFIRVKEPGKLLAKLETSQNAPVHQELKEEWEHSSDIKYQSVPNFDKPFEISLYGGRVQSLKVPTSFSLAQENLIKALLSALQIDLSAQRIVHGEHNHFNKKDKQGLFSKMETDITGDCETLYSVSPALAEWRRELANFTTQDNPIEVIKTKNYGHCHHRVAYHFGVPEGAEWTGTAHKPREEQFMKHSKNTRILVGKQGPIYKSEATSKVHVSSHLYGKQKIEVLSTTWLYLESFEKDSESEWPIPEGYRVVSNLLYSLSLKQVPSKDWSSESQQQQYNKRTRRSAYLPKSVGATNFNRRSSSESDSSSADSSSAYINDEIPNMNEPAYAALYMHPQPHGDKKQGPMNAQKLVQEIAQQLQNPNNMVKVDVLTKFNILVRLIASMSFDQLTQTSRSIEVAKSSNNGLKSDMWMTYRDAVTQAGTLPAFQQIKAWLQSKKIQEEEAAEVVASLADTIRYPTKELMKQFFELAMSSEIKEQKFLNTTILIAATKLINLGQVDNATTHSFYPTHMYGRLARKHDRFVPDEILPRLRQELRRAVEQGDSHKIQVYIQSIGNLGHRQILYVFAPYLEGKVPVSTHIRTLIVENLHVLANQRDRYVRAVLYSILRNRNERYEVRIAAAHSLFISHPTNTMMQGMAQMTHDDHCKEVRAYLRACIETAAQLQQPRNLDVARSAQAVVNDLTDESFGYQYSAKRFIEAYEPEYGLAVVGWIASIGSEDSLLPKNLKLAFKTNVHGWHNQLKVSGSVSSIRQVMDFVKEHINNEKKTPTQANHKYSADKIAEILHFKHDPENPLEAYLYMNILRQQRYFAFDEESLKQLVETVKEYFDKLEKGTDFHYTKVVNSGQVSVMFPVATGMPFIYKYKEPTLVHIQGKANSKPGDQKKTIYNAEINLTVAKNIDGSAGVLDTMSNMFASAGVETKYQLTLPLKLHYQWRTRAFSLQPLHADQDTMVAHYSVWPYTANQNKDSLVTPSEDPTTKLLIRKNKVHSIDTQFGETIGMQFHLQGYSYSSDFKNFGNLLEARSFLSTFIYGVQQKDLALTHYNFKFLGKQSQNNGVTFTAKYDNLYNQKQGGQNPLTASEMQDSSPNSEGRCQEILKRVASGINNAWGHVVDFSVVFEGKQPIEYVASGAFANSLTDPKSQFAVFAGRNSAKLGNTQVNAVGWITLPAPSSLNYQQSLKRDLKANVEIDIKFGQRGSGNIHIQGLAERSKKFIEALGNDEEARECVEEIAQNNYYQNKCVRALLLAHTPDYIKATVSHKEVSEGFKNLAYQAYRTLENYFFWYTDPTPEKKTSDGKLEFEIKNNYFEKHMNFDLTSSIGHVHYDRVPLPSTVISAMSLYSPLKLAERLFSDATQLEYQPICSIDHSRIWTFSNRSYDYSVTRSWHVVMHDDDKYVGKHSYSDEQLVVLARRTTESHQDVYISYKSMGKDLEIEIQPAPQGSNKHNVKVTTNAKKVSDGELTAYWDEDQEAPLLEYYTQADGVLMLNIRQDRLRTMYDGQRLVLFANGNRNNTFGLCGQMNGQPRDDYFSPSGIVDQPEHYGASFALDTENPDPKTQELQNESKRIAYQPNHVHTMVLHSDNDWRNTFSKSSSSSSSSEENWQSQNVYRTKSYEKKNGSCQKQQQIQYYENHGEICVTTTPLDCCQAQCKGDGYTVKTAQVVCRPKFDHQFRSLVEQIRQGQNPQVGGAGVPKTRQFRIPASCSK